MNSKITDALASRKMTLILLAAYALLMGTATFVEKYQGTTVAKDLIYYSPLFLLIQLLMTVNFALVTYRGKLISRRKWAYLTLHGALVVILGGALVTHLTGVEGTIHLREGEKSHLMVVKKGGEQEIHHLPFDLELTRFKLTRYPGSNSPSSYESFLNVYMDGTCQPHHIYMNKVLDLKGYRFFQASYDPDERGSILAVNQDAAGRSITYVGYLLLFAGWLGLLASRHSRFRRLWQQLKYAWLPLLWLLPSGNAAAQDRPISTAHADRFGQLPIQSNNGRIIPVNTFASEIVRKLKAESLLGDLSPEQLLLSMLTYPADWALIPLVEVKEQQIADAYGWKTGRISYREAFDEHNYYRLHQAMEAIYRKSPAERDRTDKELLAIDERINLLHEILTHRMPRLYPNPADTVGRRWMAAGESADGATPLPAEARREMLRLDRQYFDAVKEAAISQRWDKADKELLAIAAYQNAHAGNGLIVPQKIQAEVLYNQLNIPRVCQFGYLLAGLFLLLLSFRSHQPSVPLWRGILQHSLTGAVLLLFLLHTAGLGMRWYISGYAPWSNSYETMVALAWAGVCCGFLFARRNLMVTALAVLFSGCVLFVSGLSWMDPQITPLVPVLKSPWLMAHVASLVMAYGFLGISCMIGTAYLLLSLFGKCPSAHGTQLTVINELSMTLGTGLLSVGIFLGAVWANESWGRYWSWDPKETWALISLITYTAVLHSRWLGKQQPLYFQLMAQTAFLTILMTFLGVNYFLSGMHSYGSHDTLSAIPWWGYALFGGFFVLPGTLALLGRKRGTNRRQHNA